MWKIIEKNWKTLAIVWFVFISVLFFLPGSALPKEDALDKIYFDKWVHTAFFFILIFLGRYSLPVFSTKANRNILLLALTYAFGVELIQKYFIPNRSFDLGDVLADMVGSLVAVVFWTRRYIKK